MGWFPVGLEENENKWKFDIIPLLAVIGSSAIQKHMQAITASPFAIFPRLMPAPESLLDTERPTRPPSVKDVKIVGVKSGIELDELNFFANLIHNVNEMEEYEFRVYRISYATRDSEEGMDSKIASKVEDSYRRVNRHRIPIKLKTFCWLNFVTLVSILITVGLYIWAGCIHDGTALVGLATMSLSTSVASLSARWYPRLSGRSSQAEVPSGDVIIRTRAGAFVLVYGDDDVIRELYEGMEDCEYMFKGHTHHQLLGTSTLLLMASIILLSNCGSEMQIAIGVAYIILNALYWLLALLVEPRDLWDMSRYKIEFVECRPSTPDSSYTETLWAVINMTGSVDWVTNGELIPQTPAWDQWLQEAKEHIGKDWDPVKRKDELMNPRLAYRNGRWFD
ncbi:hypothetical protein AbraIFM66950_009939 [Aspergillus brasiliensis]|uniref:Uncharacterized protein n=1 Tax=Aspergillus brasiliensis (strain CBS 101740 / IMI 381727 / IBT 21946) TaxID=767769 RepID=A0A1L9UDM3_ASPBC|nr:hypothetical protein ASPBRDRAFT_209260 [Aspergillus brasiliensis CBS 101740]GKZ38025.1 hypothetical protein AbraIFM66950_009939 [Aspergillus brasiliensis]